MSMIKDMLEKLAEMFPKQDYQSRLDRYISSRNPQTPAEVDYYAHAFERNEFRGLGL